MIGGIFGPEAKMTRLREELIFEFAQLAFAILFVNRIEAPCLHKRADAASGFHDAQSFKLEINLRHGVCVDSQIDGHLSHSRQLFANLKLARRYRKSNRPLELMVQRRWMSRVDVE
jgi:hypothetical protein